MNWLEMPLAHSIFIYTKIPPSTAVYSPAEERLESDCWHPGRLGCLPPTSGLCSAHSVRVSDEPPFGKLLILTVLSRLLILTGLVCQNWLTLEMFGRRLQFRDTGMSGCRAKPSVKTPGMPTRDSEKPESVGKKWGDSWSQDPCVCFSV